MIYRQVERKIWKEFLELVSTVMEGNQVELEAVGLDIGDQIEEAWTSMEGMSYDPAIDVVYLHTPPSSHAIRAPKEIVAEEEGLTVRSISVRDGMGRLRIMTFRQPLMLPPAAV